MKQVKEVHCSICGNKSDQLTRCELTDGNTVCFDCFSDIPSYIKERISSYYDLEAFRELIDYLEYSEEQLKPKFVETAHYGKLHIDEVNGLFYIDDAGCATPMYSELKNVTFFDMDFSADEVKEGPLGNKVLGSVHAALKVAFPKYFYIKPIVEKVKTKSNFLGTKAVYENPTEMEAFSVRFMRAWHDSVEESENQSQVATQTDMSEFEKVKVLFMIDDIKNLTLAEVKRQGNRLTVIRGYNKLLVIEE